jgi:hypothetical protein
MSAQSPSTSGERLLLADFAYNKFSQNGEDGIVEKIFALIGTTSKLCVEFGAWDGYHLSNTANLWTNGWKAILIEGDPRRYDLLKRNVSKHDCLCVCAYVSRDGPDALEEILKGQGVKGEIDLLSIDIDGDDYYVLQSLRRLRPRVIICEYNPTIPAEVDLYANYPSRFGASVQALCRVAGSLGYVLVAVTDTNCFFVRSEYEVAFAAFERRIERIKLERQLVHLITDFRGDYVIHGAPPYGIGTPYRGALNGDVTRVSFRGAIAGALFRALRWGRSFVRRHLPR